LFTIADNDVVAVVREEVVMNKDEAMVLMVVITEVGVVVTRDDAVVVGVVDACVGKTSGFLVVDEDNDCVVVTGVSVVTAGVEAVVVVVVVVIIGVVVVVVVVVVVNVVVNVVVIGAHLLVFSQSHGDAHPAKQLWSGVFDAYNELY